MLKSNCVYNNVDVVYSIGDIHGDYQTFKKILLDIGLCGLKTVKLSVNLTGLLSFSLASSLHI